jgi:hypothetical protein
MYIECDSDMAVDIGIGMYFSKIYIKRSPQILSFFEIRSKDRIKLKQTRYIFVFLIRIVSENLEHSCC